jgi:hypothetical protein
LAIEYGVSKKTIVDCLESIKSDFEAMQFKQPKPAELLTFQKNSLHKISDIIYRMNKNIAEDLMLQAALYFILIDGENPYIIDADANQRKWDICQSDPEMRAFFLDTIEYVLKNWNNGAK